VIVTITPNPSIDRTLRIPPLIRGGVQRASSATAEAGGKGVNVSRALASEGHATLAIVPLSASAGALFSSMLGGAAPLEAVRVSGEIRTNVSLVEDDGTVTKVNEPGPTLLDREVEALLERTARLAAKAAWVAGCGSLPPGVPPDFYARLAARMPAPVRVAVDADGPALRATLEHAPALIKPNHAELEELIGRALPTLGDVVAAADELLGGGLGGVLVSLGADGAVFVDRAGATHAEAKLDDVLNAVGAGDALLAGFLAGGGSHAALRNAVAWSVAACRSQGTQMRPVEQADVDAVVVHPRPLPQRRLGA
jgi:1-phosphofructokinase